MSDKKTQQVTEKTLKPLLINYIGIAKAELSDDAFNKLAIPQLQRYVFLLAECVPVEYLVDKALIRHGIHGLVQGWSIEQTVMHVFLLYVYKLYDRSSRHPLEKGVIRQQILGVLPIFEAATQNGLMALEAYDRNADALAHIADDTDELPALFEALGAEYERYNH